MIFHENRLPADDSHMKYLALFVIFEKTAKNLNCRLLQIIDGALRVKALIKNAADKFLIFASNDDAAIKAHKA